MINFDLTEEYITLDDTSQLELIQNSYLKSVPAYSYYLQKIKALNSLRIKEYAQQEEREYQLAHAAMMCCRRYNFMGWEQRTGKTLTCVLIMLGLYSAKYTTNIFTSKGLVKASKECPTYSFEARAKSIHISVPSILAAMSWIKELRNTPGLATEFTLVESYKDLIECDTPIIIYSHDFPKNRIKRSGKSISKALAKLRPNLLIVDEVHGLKNSSQRTQHMLRVRHESRRVLCLSGTPSEGTLNDLWQLMSFTYGRYWPYSKPELFVRDYGVKQKLNTNYLLSDISSDKFLQQLDINKMPSYYKLMRRFLHRLTLSDPEVISCVKVPETKAQLHSLDPNPVQKEIYDTYIDERRIQLIRAANAITVKQKAEALKLINPLIELTNQWELDGTSPKLDWCREIVGNSHGKVIIFCSRVNSARSVSRYLKDEFGEETIIRVYASDPEEEIKTLSQDERIRRVTGFQYNDEVIAGVFSINIASEAIELNAASDVVFYCMPWSSIKIRQAISRPVGPGNPHRTINIHYPFYKSFIDEYQVSLAISKIQSINLLDYNINSLEGEADLSPTEVIRKILS